jgi:DNA damage-binding protein 1
LTSLGDLPVHFTPCRVNGKEAVFAAGSRAMVLTWQRDSIHQSPVILKVCLWIPLCRSLLSSSTSGGDGGRTN